MGTMMPINGISTETWANAAMTRSSWLAVDGVNSLITLILCYKFCVLRAGSLINNMDFCFSINLLFFPALYLL
jgi:hypothetical protein